ncbi:hypothetical protein DV737_g4715, partial [Chaetothyriales sp. CBS 132003]
MHSPGSSSLTTSGKHIEASSPTPPAVAHEGPKKMRWLLLLLTILSTAFRLSYADLPPFLENSAFDKGDYGTSVAQLYQSTDIWAPRLNFFEKAGSCHDDGLFFMLAIRGWAVPKPAPMILDGRGSLVWTGPSYVQPYNLQVQTYRGEQFLTFWAGNDGVKGHGSGLYYMLDENYNLRYTLRGGNGMDGDLHEFYITPNGTALITIYQIIHANLTTVGHSDNEWIWDGLFQEIDVETNDVIFQWRASDHLLFTDSQWGPGSLGKTRNEAWDWFHINSVEKDDQGNYLISSRWMHAIYYIDGTSGNIIWTLGGPNNDFQDLSDGHATNFASQHHARWSDGYTSITLFDNSNPGPGNPSSGMWLDLDFEAMTVKLRTRFLSMRVTSSSSQGSLQTLPSGNVLVGYGSDAQYVEFTRDGNIVCEVHAESASVFGSAAVQSYRVFKHAWKGFPLTTPDITQVNGTVYVSWNGATEVRHWLVEEAISENATSDEFREVKRVPKLGFETMVATIDIEHPYIRLAAVDQEGRILARTGVVERGEPRELPAPNYPYGQVDRNGQAPYARKQTLVMIEVVMVGVMILASLVFVGFLIVRHVLKYYNHKRASGRPVVYETIDDLEMHQERGEEVLDLGHPPADPDKTKDCRV